MAIIKEEVEIRAAPERVFEAIRELESYPRYVKGLHQVEHLGGWTYCMGMKIAGLTLTWQGVVTEYEPPSRFAWQATSGLDSRGRFDLEPLLDGTRVYFQLEYELPGRWLNRLLGDRATPWVSKEGARILDRVRIDLEQETAGGAPPGGNRTQG